MWADSDQMDAISWWKFWASSKSLTNGLGFIAIRLLEAPATSASVERSFSMQGAIHTKTRNRLVDKRIEKLLYIKFNLQLVKNQKAQKAQQDQSINQSIKVSENWRSQMKRVLVCHNWSLKLMISEFEESLSLREPESEASPDTDKSIDESEGAN
ncbi:hypothetical protein DMENIID0001_060560 [Sergentomyia squamirostris]